MSSKPQIPAITIDNSATQPENDQAHHNPKTSPSSPPHIPTHARSPSDPNYLIPGGAQARQSQDEPPSPTGSASSVKFATSVALRDNQPNASSGANSLSMLQPRASSNAHHDRKHSASSSVSGEGTEPDHIINGNNQASSTSSNTAVTPNDQTQFKDSDTKKGKKHKKNDEKDKDSDEGDDAKPTEIADVTDCAPFGFRPKQLAELAENKSLKDLADVGGVDKLIEGLGTDREKGLSPHAVGLAGDGGEKSGGSGALAATKQDRQRVFGINQMPAPKSKSLLQLMWIALQDKVLVLLSIAAVVSLALGLYSDFGVEHFEPCEGNPTQNCPGPRVDFVEGVAIMVAIFIVVMVGSLNDWQKERQFRALNDKKEDRTVKVIRDGKEAQINIKEVMVGDIATMEPGEIIPCDGIFVSGHNVKCDESGATGESDAIKKFSFEDAYKELQEQGKTKKDCFILSGSKVLEGVGSYVVVAIGERSFNGRILLALRKPVAATPLQEKLNNLAELIAKVGAACGLILFTSLMIKFFVQLKSKPNRSANEKAMAFVQILIISVTLVVVAVPEGLPLAVTLALAFATKRMTGEKLLVRVLDSCETMANANVVCTDKTGTLTQNVMHVVAGSVGVHAKFVKNLKENLNRSDANEESGGSRKHDQDFAIEQDDLSQVLPPNLQTCLNEAIAVNSTAFEDVDKETGEIDFVGSKTETALLRFAKDQGWPSYRETRANAQVEQVLPFDSANKYMGVIVKHGDKYRAYFKGASEILTRECTRHVVVGTPDHPIQGSKDDPIETKEIDSKTKENIANTIIFYANQMLRTIAICYCDVEQWPPAGKGKDEVPLSELVHDLTLIGITGIEDPLRPSVRDAIKDAAHAGVAIKMCTGDNVLTARSIAAQCGIYTEGGVIMEGPVFRRLSDKDREDVVPHLQVLARSSPEDKKILVETLMKQGNVVGVTGDGTNDGPALKEANVGFSMGIAGTEVAKEASDIILMDDNFASIVSAIMWGRCVNDSVRKFLQFQISVNITAVLITFISSVASDEEESVLTAVQLLWINIIMDTFAALALATDPATRRLLDRKPDARNAPLFTLEMGKMIIGQAMYQTFIVLVLHFAGPSFFNVAHDNKELSAMVFNVFVFCQIFNSINCRTIDGTKNVLAGISKNYYFITITLFEVIIQVLIIYFGGVAFQVRRISGKYWAMSIGLGFVSLPLGFLIRLIPNGPLRRMLIHIHIIQDPVALPTKNPNANTEQYNDAIDMVRDNLLGTFSNIRGGRVRGSSMIIKARRRARKHDSGVTLPSLMTMVPGLVASSVAARWQPAQTGLHDPANGDPSKSSAALWEGKLQLHPDTKSDSEAYRRWGAQIEKSPTNVSRSNVNEKR